MTKAELPARLPTSSPEAVSYSVITPLSPVAARIFPAGEKETTRTCLTEPRNVSDHAVKVWTAAAPYQGE